MNRELLPINLIIEPIASRLVVHNRASSSFRTGHFALLLTFAFGFKLLDPSGVHVVSLGWLHFGFTFGWDVLIIIGGHEVELGVGALFRWLLLLRQKLLVSAKSCIYDHTGLIFGRLVFVHRNSFSDSNRWLLVFDLSGVELYLVSTELVVFQCVVDHAKHVFKAVSDFAHWPSIF